MSSRFFETLRIPVIHGRGIEQRDIDQGRTLVVANEALARRLWVEQDPVGRPLMVDGRSFEVVGIVRHEGLREGGETAHPYLFSSDTSGRQQGSVLVRVKGDAAAALGTLRREIRAADADVPINQATWLTDILANQQGDARIAMGVLSFAGALALLLTTLGLYGVVALWVGQRTREIGIRMALGATPTKIVTLVLRVLWDPIVDPFLHRAQYRGEVRTLYENLLPGMTSLQVRHEIDSGNYPYLEFHRDGQLWSASAPSEFGAGNWVLVIEFQGDQVSAVRVRKGDGLQEFHHPLEAPPDKVQSTLFRPAIAFTCPP